jgi:hypothetical protein
MGGVSRELRECVRQQKRPFERLHAKPSEHRRPHAVYLRMKIANQQDAIDILGVPDGVLDRRLLRQHKFTVPRREQEGL